jgi:hypothetical protein
MATICRRLAFEYPYFSSVGMSALSIMVWVKEVGEKGYTKIGVLDLVFRPSNVPDGTRYINYATGERGRWQSGEQIPNPLY